MSVDPFGVAGESNVHGAPSVEKDAGKTVAFGYRGWRQYRDEKQLTISSPNGIDEARFVTVAGTEQWITIRSRNRNNPVLFIVHGGPGSALSPFPASFLRYEKEWTVVQWDQRGAGKTFARAGGKIPAGTTLADISTDGIGVVELVLERLQKDTAVVLGFSWGSVVGLEMVRLRPQVFSAYVGTGLSVHKDDGQRIAYSRLLGKARRDNRRDAIAALEAIGPPPHRRLADTRTQNEWAATLTGQSSGTANRVFALLVAPRYSLADARSYFDGYLASDEHFDLGAIDLRTMGRRFAVPFIIIQGGEDYGTPVELARSYFDLVEAPYKRFVVLDGAGHTALTDDSDRFAAAMDEHVRR
jgi:pimeloyl-ACP methyl ester carboxylesterase